MPGKKVWDDSEITRHKRPAAGGTSTFQAAAALKRSCLCRQSRSWIRWRLREGIAGTLETADPAEGELRHPLFKGIREDLG
jgi:hypothetical protein